MNRIKELRRSHDLNQEELGALIGVQKSAVCKYEVGRVPPPHDVLIKLCDYFNVSADYLLGRDAGLVTPFFKDGAEDAAQSPSISVPLLGSVHAGLPMLADENVLDYIPVAASEGTQGECFFMNVVGDCMEDDFIPEGARVLVRMQPTVENGGVAVIRLGDEVLLRKVKRAGDMLMLIPANSRYEPMLVSSSEVEIIGRVVEARIKF